jgi:hypothetical protein
VKAQIATLETKAAWTKEPRSSIAATTCAGIGMKITGTNRTPPRRAIGTIMSFPNRKLVIAMTLLVAMMHGFIANAENLRTQKKEDKTGGRFIYNYKLNADGKIVTEKPDGEGVKEDDPVNRKFTDEYLKKRMDLYLTTYKGLEKKDGYTEEYNCFAFAFLPQSTRPKVWVGLDIEDVPKILKDQGWGNPIPENQAKKGDIVLYKIQQTNIATGATREVFTHAAVVTDVGGGKVTKVLSKWGANALFEHDPKTVPQGEVIDGGRMPRYGAYEVYSGGKPLIPPPQKKQPQRDTLDLDSESNASLGLASPPIDFDLTAVSIPNVNSVVVQTAHDIEVGQEENLAAIASEDGIVAGFSVPVQFFFVAGPNPGDSGQVFVEGDTLQSANSSGIAQLTVRGQAPGLIVFGVEVDGVVAYGTFRVVSGN